MRRMIVLSLLLSSLAAPALAVQDRYGPPRAPEVETADAAPQRLLSWTGKSAEPDYEGERMPAPLAPWAQRSAAPTPPATPQPPLDRPRAAAQPASAAPMPPPVAPWTDRLAGGPPPQQASLLPPPVAPWTEWRSTSPKAGGQRQEGLTLNEGVVGNSVGKAPGGDDIPITQTKQNAAATRNSPID